MVQHLKQQPVHSTSGKPTHSSAQDIYLDVFQWQLVANVQPVDSSPGLWAITLIIQATGGSSETSFFSSTGYTKAGGIAQIPFPAFSTGSVSVESYGMSTVCAQYMQNDNIMPQTIGVHLEEVAGQVVVSIVNTEVSTTWIIGARDICLIGNDEICHSASEVLAGEEVLVDN
jgi:hypothetical protein